MSEMSHYGMQAQLQPSEALISLRQSWLAGETCLSAPGSHVYLKCGQEHVIQDKHLFSLAQARRVVWSDISLILLREPGLCKKP